MTRVLEAAEHQDSFISYRPVPANFAFIRENGIEAFVRLEMEKLRFLESLIDNYDEGRSKSFYCTSCQLIPLENLREALADAKAKITADAGIKDKAKLVRAAISQMADSLKIELKLRK